MQHAGIGAATDDRVIGNVGAVAVELVQQLGHDLVFHASRPAEAHRAYVRAAGDLAGAAHQTELAAALEQPHVVQHMIERDELLRRMRAHARLRAQRIDPADHVLVELLRQAHGVVDARALLHQPGQNLVDIGDRKGVVSAVILNCARGTGALAVPDLALAITLAHKQDVFRRPTPGDQHRHRLRLVKAGQVEEIAVLPVVVLDVVVPLPRWCRRQDRDRIAAHQPHQLRAPARELALDWIGHDYLADRCRSLVQYVPRWDVPFAQRLQLVEHQLHADAYELGEFGQGGLVGLFAVGGINAGARDLGQVAYDLAEFSRQTLRIGGTAGPPAARDT